MISDFGLSKIASEPETMPAMQTACGTPGYVGESRNIVTVQINFVKLPNTIQIKIFLSYQFPTNQVQFHHMMWVVN